MFYAPKFSHGLPGTRFAAIVTPRQMAWISSREPLGDSLARDGLAARLGHEVNAIPRENVTLKRL